MIIKAQRLALGIALLVLVSFPAMAQDYLYQARLFGGAGIGKFYDDEGSLGKGWTYRTGAEWRPLSRLGLQGELVGIHHTRGDYFNVRGDAAMFSGNAVYYFSRSRVQPYLLAGIGVLKTSYNYGWPAGDPRRYSVSKTETQLSLGGGMQVFLNRRWSLDPHLRLAASAPSGYALVNYFSISAGYHW